MSITFAIFLASLCTHHVPLLLIRFGHIQRVSGDERENRQSPRIIHGRRRDGNSPFAPLHLLCLSVALLAVDEGILLLIRDGALLVIQLGGGVEIPPEVEVRRVAGLRDAAGVNEAGDGVDDGGEVGQGTREPGPVLALGPGDDGLVEHRAHERARGAVGGGVAGQAFQNQVAAHGHDVCGVVGVWEGDGGVGQVGRRGVEPQRRHDGGDVGVMSAVRGEESC